MFSSSHSIEDIYKHLASCGKDEIQPKIVQTSSESKAAANNRDHKAEPPSSPTPFMSIKFSFLRTLDSRPETGSEVEVRVPFGGVTGSSPLG